MLISASLSLSLLCRVPRSLLPGARSSRLRDRQKEERELLVKKAFVEDMLKENHTLSVLLGRDEKIYAVLWTPNLLPCLNKDSQLPTITDAIATLPGEGVSHNHSNENKKNNLLDEMSLYMETLNDVDLDDGGVSSDFQIDSGPLACVACGILGFPFMSVVQLSERASMELQLVDQSTVNPCTPLNGSVKSSASGIRLFYFYSLGNAQHGPSTIKQLIKSSEILLKAD